MINISMKAKRNLLGISFLLMGLILLGGFNALVGFIGLSFIEKIPLDIIFGITALWAGYRLIFKGDLI